jgi:hypothetical protein
MKHILIFSIILFLVFENTEAQNKVHVGVAGGPTGIFILKQNNFGVLQEDEFSDPIVRQSELAYLSYFGYTLEVNGAYYFKPNNFIKPARFALESAIIFSKQGQHYEDFMFERTAVGQRKQVNRNVDLSYLQIPVLFKYYSGSKTHKFYASTGPQIGFLLKANEELFVDGVEKNYGITEKDKFRTFDWGLVVNLGYEYHINNNLYLNFGWHNYVGIIDLNGKFIRDLGWFSKNDTSYRKSRNFRTGLNIGVNYILGSVRRY